MVQRALQAKKKQCFAMSVTGKQKRQELDLKTRFEVIKYSQANPQESARKLADKFHRGKTQIQSIY